MDRKTTNYIFFTFLVLLFVLKMIMVLQTSTISYDAYYGLRYSEYVHENYVPLIFDGLSYQGRISVTNATFYSLISLLTFIFPAFIFFKYFGILFTLFIVYLIYKINLKLFSNNLIALFTGIIAGMMPMMVSGFLNEFSSIVVFATLFLAIIYTYSDVEQDKSNKLFLAYFIIATIITPYSLLLILGFLLYFILLRLSSLPIRDFTKSTLLFTTLFSIWYHLLFYKSALTNYGISIIWQNIPEGLINLSYQRLTPYLALFLIGLIPLMLGLFGIYRAIFVKRRRVLMLVSSFAFVFTIFLWAGVLPLQEGLFLLSISLLVLSGNGLKVIFDYLNKTLFHKWSSFVIIILVLLTILNFVPLIFTLNSLEFNSPNQNELDTMQFLKENTPEDSTILTDVVEGHFLAYQSNRKNFYDTSFFLMPSADQRYQDSRTMFLSKSKIPILEQMTYYDIDYVYISKLTTSRYEGKTFLITSDSCFKKIFSTKTTEVYLRECSI